MQLRCGRFLLALDAPVVMGVLNVTPDSFSDGGRFLDRESAIARAHRLIEEGAGIVDIGGESTRPGARPVSEEEEIERIIPVVRALRDVATPISVDTRRPAVMRAALDAGASMINDIQALGAPGALDAVAAGDCAVCLMHMQGTPATMQEAPQYRDVTSEVIAYLEQRISSAEKGGIVRGRIVADPGFGFGKSAAHNVELMRSFADLGRLGVPLVAGWSRKSTLGSITGKDVPDRLVASVTAGLLAAQRGARILRVHDVREMQDALAVWKVFRGDNK